ncbi:uncharacterized protein LOC126931633 [Macaca thibetana thibetana]|uniref:uncharacterized protein LOC126931633 n=1 Tax=Macaca thibetana thibetana TaxID=257877 RepID=UPI0021BC46FA|nr:uncharacterized protein LOC126931633 [Macaca thibetana thibetana]
MWGGEPEGTFRLAVITRVKSKIFLPGRAGHLDQIPYILIWQDLVENPPPWLSPFQLAPEPWKEQVDRRRLTHPDPPPGLSRGRKQVDGRRLAHTDPLRVKVTLKGRQGRREGALHRLAPPQPPDSTVALPLREIGPPDDTGIPRLQYWPFSTSDLYNWKTQSARFSDNPKDLMALLDSVMFTHQPTWDDCQQLLRNLFTTEERERIQVEARKLVPGDNGQPTANPDLINATFPLTRPAWDYNTAEVCL